MDPIEQARDLIDRAGRVTVLTGAGISTDSGIPDFRGPNGVWTKSPRAEASSDIDVWMMTPALRWQTWSRLTSSPFRSAQPNDGHRALVELERRDKLVALITQNVDGLHQAAGSNPDKVIEFHGTMNEAMCMGDGIIRPWQGCGAIVSMDEVLNRFHASEEQEPHCLACGGLMKEATVSFGQNPSEENSRRAGLAAQQCDLMLAVGTTLVVTPVANMVPMAKTEGASVVIVNGSPTEYDYIADVVLRGSISEVLPQIVGG